jgi:hypothetical protein
LHGSSWEPAITELVSALQAIYEIGKCALADSCHATGGIAAVVEAGRAEIISPNREHDRADDQ